jgi:crotonobetainyl-CoA:carnitine CoA-transferase CaiB-like acyl-CoA transferase
MPMALCDKICGHVLASAVGMALFHRERTGKGQSACPNAGNIGLTSSITSGTASSPGGKRLGYPRMLTPPPALSTKDGHICILATTDTQSRHLFKQSGVELADDGGFDTGAAHRQYRALLEIVIERMLRRTTAEWRERLDAFDVPNGVVTDLEGLLADPYLGETGFFEQVEHPSEGKMLTMAIPVAFSGSPGDSFRLPPPRLGEHSAQILREVGCTEANR